MKKITILNIEDTDLNNNGKTIIDITDKEKI